MSDAAALTERVAQLERQLRLMKNKTDRRQVMVRMPSDLYARVEAECKARDLGNVSLVCCILIEEALEK